MTLTRAAASLVGLLLAVAPPAAAAQTYPLRAVLDAFRGACGTRASLAAAQAGTAPAGWTGVNAANTPVGPVLAFGKAAGAKVLGPSGKMLDDRVFERTVAGERLYIIVSGIEREGTRVTGCRLYDPGEQRAVDIAAVTAWVGRAPSTTVERPELTRLAWEPGFAVGSDSFELFRIPAGSPVLQMIKVDGLALKVDWVEQVR